MIVKPDYNRSILSISSSIMKYYGISSNYKSLQELDEVLNKKYKNVVFLILDCLGMNILENNLDENSILRKNLLTSVTSVFPPTTAAATVAFHTGTSPYENGWIGWMPYFKEDNGMIELFTGKDFYTQEQKELPMDKGKLKYVTIYEKIIEKNKDIAFHKIFPSFTPGGANTFWELCNNIKNACNNNHCNLISAYWDEPDHTIHRHKITGQEVKEVLKDIENNLEKLVHELKDTLIIISADHGAVDVEEVYLNEIPEIDNYLKLPPAIESRFVTFFIKDGMQEKFVELLDKYFKNQYLLYTKDEFLNSNLLGLGKPHARIKDYFGDFIFIGTGNINIRYSIDGTKNKTHVADHSGITESEMLVPVIAIECK